MAVKIDVDKCDGCGDCVSECPCEAIVIKDGKAVVSDECIDCGICFAACTKGAISE